MKNRCNEKPKIFNGTGTSVRLVLVLFLFICLFPTSGHAVSNAFGGKIFDPGHLKPVDSKLKVKIGQQAPDFSLKSLSGQTVTLSQYRGKKNVLISFVPAAWTPVCSDQWPGYNIAKPLFQAQDTILLGITVDNRPTLFAWTREMDGLWFPVLSDFWPHGKVSDSYGVLRTDGTSERALFLVDKKGILRFIHVSDINIRPELGYIIQAIKGLKP
ncbi:peroxiredoxin [Desulfospira joergensenii]|uniref:peroxiredoxin n=1 Tax=Desulfospira joergensenii TaxID=53329 RepID=UPI0003B5240B|nr:peroxiredoxin [Desulfospira joergensenii]